MSICSITSIWALYFRYSWCIALSFYFLIKYLHVLLVQAEKNKRRAQYSAAVKRKEAERTERKMAAVARDRAWAERLIELKQLEEEKKAAIA